MSVEDSQNKATWTCKPQYGIEDPLIIPENWAQKDRDWKYTLVLKDSARLRDTIIADFVDAFQ
ncbi:MAG: hypothetical protein GQ536_02730 [Candidatus Aminicenantes bacterium]|jgi:hypothetical protein|nr:hypothetical protein [Candidatus Aminicenantes bacterium]